MARKFEQEYRISSLDEVLTKENAIHFDFDLRLDALEVKSDADKSAAEVINRGVAIIEQVLVPQATEIGELLDGFREGVPAAKVMETSDRRFLSDAEIADLQSRLTADEVQGIADASAATAAAAAKTDLIGGAGSARNTLKKLSDAIDVLTAGAPALLDSFLEVAAKLAADDDQLAAIMQALANRLRVDADQGLTPAQQARALANINGQKALGFSAVQQGTGIGQTPNIIKIGHSGKGPKITVDATDYGRLWADVSAYVGGTINQWLVVFPNGYARQGGFTNGEKQINFTNAFTQLYAVDAKIIGTNVDPYEVFDVNIENPATYGFVARPRYSPGGGVAPASQNYLWWAEGFIAP